MAFNCHAWKPLPTLSHYLIRRSLSRKHLHATSSSSVALDGNMKESLSEYKSKLKQEGKKTRGVRDNQKRSNIITLAMKGPATKRPSPN